MHGNNENMLFWSEFDFGITFQFQFLELNIFSYFIYNFGKKNWYENKEKQKIISTLLHIIKSLEIFISCKNWKRTILLHFMEDWKVVKIWKTCFLFYGCHT